MISSLGTMTSQVTSRNRMSNSGMGSAWFLGTSSQPWPLNPWPCRKLKLDSTHSLDFLLLAILYIVWNLVFFWRRLKRQQTMAAGRQGVQGQAWFVVSAAEGLRCEES